MNDLRIACSPRALALTLGLVLAACGGGGGGGSTPSFAYGTPAATYTACTAIAPNAPTLGALVASSFSVAPPLPSGLALDGTTGLITGTPDATSTAASYTVTAVTDQGQARATLSIAVDSVTPAFDYGAGNVVALARGLASSSTPNVTAGGITSWAVTAGSLPNGLALDPATGEISGTTPFVDQQVLTIQATDCTGATAQADVTIDVEHPRARGVWVANGSDGALTSYLRRASDGTLAPTGFVASAAGSNLILAAHPSGRFLYATSNATQEVEVYDADPVTGRLSATGSAVDLGTVTITAMACDPRGESLYAATNDALVHQFAIDPATGALSALAPATVATGAGPRALVVHPGGDFVYVANQTAQTITVFARDPLTGALTETGAPNVGFGVFTLAVHPDGAVLYAAGPTNASLAGYAITAGTGALSAASWSPIALGHTGTLSLAVASTGSGLYAANAFNALVDQWSLDASGQPSALVPSNVALPTNALQIRLDPRGESAYVALVDGTLAVYDVDAVTAELSEAVDPLFRGRPGARFVEFQPGAADPELDTICLFALDTSASQVFAFAFDPGTGALTSAGSYDTGDNDCWSIAVHPELPRVYVSNDNTPANEGAVVALDIASDQSLAAFGSFGTDTSLDGLALDAGGRFLFQSRWDLQSVRTYTVDAGTGALTAGGTAAAETNPGALAVHPAGSLLVVPNDASDSLSLFRIDPATGALTSGGTQATATASPYQAVFHPSGRFVYVVTLATGQIEGYSVDVDTPALASIGAPSNELDLTTYAAVSPDGRYLVAVDANSNTLGVWSIDLDRTNLVADGTLAFVGTTAITGMDLLRTVQFDESGAWLLITDSGGEVQVRPFAAGPGTVGAAVASSTPGGFLRQAALRTRVR